MRIKILKVVSSLAIVTVLLVTLGCGTTSSARVGSLQTESQSVELEGVEPVRVEIEMGAGELNVAGGADELMDAGLVTPEITLATQAIDPPFKKYCIMA